MIYIYLYNIHTNSYICNKKIKKATTITSTKVYANKTVFVLTNRTIYIVVNYINLKRKKDKQRGRRRTKYVAMASKKETQEYHVNNLRRLKC